MIDPFKPYPDYKPSGIEWLGDVPKHWEVRRLKYSVKLIMGQSPSGYDYSDKPIGLPFLQGCAEFGDHSPRPVQFCHTPKKVSPIGAILMSVRAPVGRFNIADQEYGIGRGLCAILPDEEVFQVGFARYQLEALTLGLKLASVGSTYDAVSIGDVGIQPSILPPLKEQKLISRYLDKKTDQIDLLVEKTQRKIELLKEYRTSLINQCVTKGLDPNVEMKDSGVEWIGEIPKHWELRKIKHLVSSDGFRSGPFGSTLITSQLNDSGDWIVYSPENLRSEKIPNQLFVPEDRKKELEKYLVKPTDILIPIVGSLNVSMVITEDHPVGILNQRLCRLSLDDEKINIPLVSFLFKNSKLIQTQIELEKRGSILDHITKEVIFNFVIPYPPRYEQDKLFNRLTNIHSLFDSLIERNDRKIELLKEYRQALISSVVTGKVRVTEDMV